MSLLTNLNCYLNCDQAANTTRTDSTANGNNFTDTNANVGQATGIIGNACNFTAGITQELTNASVILSSGALSVQMWIKMTALPLAGQWLFWSQGSSPSNYQYLNINSAGSIGYSVSGTARTYAAGIGTAAWHHIIVTFAGGVGGALILYIDGTNVDNTTQTYGVGAAATFVGCASSVGNQPNAAIDEIGMWARALTGAEVTTLYNSGTGLAYPFTTIVPAIPPTFANSFTSDRIYLGIMGGSTMYSNGAITGALVEQVTPEGPKIQTIDQVFCPKPFEE